MWTNQRNTPPRLSLRQRPFTLPPPDKAEEGEAGNLSQFVPGQAFDYRFVRRRDTHNKLTSDGGGYFADSLTPTPILPPLDSVPGLLSCRFKLCKPKIQALYQDGGPNSVARFEILDLRTEVLEDFPCNPAARQKLPLPLTTVNIPQHLTQF